MKRFLPLLLLLLVPLVSGTAGYFGGRALRPAPPPPAKHGKPAITSVEAGKIAVQIYHPGRIDMLVTDLSVSVPEAEAATLTAPMGQARLRDRAYQVLFDAAETPLYRRDKITPEEVARTLASGLGVVAPGLKDVSVSYAVTSSAPRK